MVDSELPVRVPGKDGRPFLQRPFVTTVPWSCRVDFQSEQSRRRVVFVVGTPAHLAETRQYPEWSLARTVSSALRCHSDLVPEQVHFCVFRSTPWWKAPLLGRVHQGVLPRVIGWSQSWFLHVQKVHAVARQKEFAIVVGHRLGTDLRQRSCSDFSASLGARVVSGAPRTDQD